MYAYALYERGFVHQAHQVLTDIYQQSINFEVSRMYPGIPEYFDSRGRGVYPYLTGSASWYLFTLLTQAFGVRGHLGDLLIKPKLVLSQFDEEGNASIQTRFAERDLLITFHNPDKKDFGAYQISKVFVDGELITEATELQSCVIEKIHLDALKPLSNHDIDIFLN